MNKVIKVLLLIDVTEITGSKIGGIASVTHLEDFAKEL